MITNAHLVALERDLEADLAEARRQLQLGCEEAIAELDTHRESLGGLCAIAAHKIESLAHDADVDLDKVRMRLGELNLILAEEEMDNLATFDHFRDRLLQAIEEAGGDLAKLKGLGDTWSAGHGEIGEAWNQLSQRLELVRLHLAHEADVAKGEFETERLALAAHLEEIRLAAEKPHSRGELVGTVGREFAKFLPALKTFFQYYDESQPPAEKLD